MLDAVVDYLPHRSIFRRSMALLPIGEKPAGLRDNAPFRPWPSR